MSIFSKIREAAKQQVKTEERIPPDEMPIRLPPPPRKGPPLNPPTIGIRQDPRSIMRDQVSGLGGYLNPEQLGAFVNAPKPDNSAGQQNMADLMKQQQDTFGQRFVYPEPAPAPSPPPPPPGDTPPPPPDDGIIFPPDGPPIKYPPFDGIGFPPIDFPPNFPPINFPPPGETPPGETPPGKRPPIQVPPPGMGDPGLPPMVPPGIPSEPPIDIPGLPPVFDDSRYEDIMRQMKEMEDRYSKGIGGLTDRFDTIPTQTPPPMDIDYDAITKKVRDGLDFPPAIDRDLLMDDIMKNINIPSYDMPDLSAYATMDDLNKGIGGINLPSFDDSAIRDLIDKNKMSIDQLPGSINMPDLSAYATMDDLNKGIGGINLPSFDDSAIRDLIDKNKMSIGKIPSYDDSSIRDLINKNSGAIGNIPSYDDSAIRDLINNRASYDDSAIRDLINKNSGAIAGLPKMNLPTPSRATGMETLISPQILMGGRGR